MILTIKTFIINLVILFIFSIFSLNFGQTLNIETTYTQFDTISGHLPEIVKKQDKPYYISADIEVPPDKIVTIEPGVVFLFKNFTGLHISGQLFALGKKDNPIIFTSENNKTFNTGSTLYPNPYDWNGIYIHEDGFNTVMEHCDISYTVYGLISDTKYIKLNPVSFKENGKSNFTISGVRQPVTEKPYCYVLSTKDATKDGVNIIVLKDPKAPARNILRYTGLTAFIGGIGVGIFYATQFDDSWAQWKKINGHDHSIETLQKDSSNHPDLENKKNEDLLGMCLGMGLVFLGAVGFTWSFTF